MQMQTMHATKWPNLTFRVSPQRNKGTIHKSQSHTKGLLRGLPAPPWWHLLCISGSKRNVNTYFPNTCFETLFWETCVLGFETQRKTPKCVFCKHMCALLFVSFVTVVLTDVIRSINLFGFLLIMVISRFVIIIGITLFTNYIFVIWVSLVIDKNYTILYCFI